MRKYYLYLIGIIVISIIVAGLVCVLNPVDISGAEEVPRHPDIFPDYKEGVIPPNIAPLNFQVLEDGHAYFVSVRSDRGHPIHLFSKTGHIRIPIRKWHALLETNRGHNIFFDVYVRGEDRHWRRFRPIANTISQEDIDETLVFRFMKPAYHLWNDIGIYQRNLQFSCIHASAQPVVWRRVSELSQLRRQRS